MGSSSFVAVVVAAFNLGTSDDDLLTLGSAYVDELAVPPASAQGSSSISAGLMASTIDLAAIDDTPA